MSSIIELKPLTRVEGHGRVSVFMAGQQVEKVELALYESPRLFEVLLLNKEYREIPEIVCRICSLCSTVHRVTALLAVERALEIPISRQTRLYRELIVNGGHIQSHALHLFCLVLPDIFGVTGFAELARREPDLLALGLRLKGTGNLIQEVVGGRLIHPVTLIPGGMGQPPTRQGLMRMKEALQNVIPDAWEACRIFARWGAERTGIPTPDRRYLALKPSPAAPLFGSMLRIGNSDHIPVEDYRKHIIEKVTAGSHAKRSLVAGETVTTGAVARLNLGQPLLTAGTAAFAEYSDMVLGTDIMANNLSQAIELIDTIERSIGLIDTLLEEGNPAEALLPPSVSAGTGSAAMEAPRGVLIHSYSFGDNGRCTAADIITPTAINQAAIEADLLELARSMEGAGETEMALHLEMLVRAYDPCISCAVHMVRI